MPSLATMYVWKVGLASAPERVRLADIQSYHADFGMTEAEAWLLMAERERLDAEHKELAASEARAREATFRAKASASQPGAQGEGE